MQPYDTDSLAQVMREVLTGSKLRDGMVSKGLEHTKKFSWDRAAMETHKVYEKVGGT